MNRSHIIAAALAAAFAVPASADVLTPISVEASSTFIFNYQPEFLIDGSGLSGGLHDGNFLNHWMSGTTGEKATLTFDLGDSFRLTDARIWQYNVDFGLNRGARNVEIFVSRDGVEFVAGGSGVLEQADGISTAAQIIGIEGTGRYVRLDLLDNYGDQFTWTGLAEVRIGGIIPEPATWAMLIAGFGIVGVAARRRRKAGPSVRTA
ncbi:MAG: PEPxxWA-CTERM sorting domain-containing protein [Sandaracinobacteroides sp.]